MLGNSVAVWVGWCSCCWKVGCLQLEYGLCWLSVCFFLFATLLLVDLSALSNLFSSSLFSASSSVVYSSTTARPRSERLAILINFCLSAINFLPQVMCSFTLLSFFSVAAEKVVVASSSCSASSKASLISSITQNCSWFPFFLKLKGSCCAFKRPI